MPSHNQVIEASSTTTTAGPGSKIGILPERFDGTTDFRQWLGHFDACGDANSWTAADRLRKLPAFLRGRASSRFNALTAAATVDYRHLLYKLLLFLTPTLASPV